MTYSSDERSLASMAAILTAAPPAAQARRPASGPGPGGGPPPPGGARPAPAPRPPPAAAVRSGVVGQLEARAGPVDRHQAARRRAGDEGRAEVVATEADVRRQEVAGLDDLLPGAVRRERGDPRGHDRGDADVPVAVDGQRVEELEAGQAGDE